MANERMSQKSLLVKASVVCAKQSTSYFIRSSFHGDNGLLAMPGITAGIVDW